MKAALTTVLGVGCPSLFYHQLVSKRAHGRLNDSSTPARPRKYHLPGRFLLAFSQLYEFGWRRIFANMADRRMGALLCDCMLERTLWTDVRLCADWRLAAGRPAASVRRFCVFATAIKAAPWGEL
jgi:hypothetical protein